MTADANLQKYRAFVEAARCGSFTLAAEKLSYTQSAISRMVADLEREWGFPLLERGRGGVRPTSEGAQMIPRAQALIDSYEQLQEQADKVNGLTAGVIRIGTFSSVATHWLPQAIKRFREDYPGIDYELLLGDYVEIERWVAEGRVDCGFTRAPVVAGLDATLLHHDEIVAVVPPQHELAALDAIPLESLCEDPFMLLGREGNDEMASIFTACGLQPDVRFTTWDDYSIMAMVESGAGVALLHSLILTRTPYDLAVRPLTQPVFREICVATRTGRAPSLATQKFLEYLQP